MIKFEQGIFRIETKHTGYYMAERAGVMENLHYGKKIHVSRDVLSERMSVGYGTDTAYRESEGALSLLHLCLELSPMGKGDYRRGALDLELANGSHTVDVAFEKYEVKKGCVSPASLPSAHEGEETLILHFGSLEGVKIRLYYTTYPECDVITRRMEVENQTDGALTLHRALSYQLDLPRNGYKLTTFTGAWARERHETEHVLGPGTVSFGSLTGTSSHYCNPFFMVADQRATEEMGEVFGLNLIYSGSHHGQVETGPYAKTRVMAGIQPDGFAWTLEPGKCFETPEAVLTFSDKGKNGMSQNCHRFVKEHIVRGTWAKKERPVLLNNWEATYFDFTERKLLGLAKAAKKAGVELFVLDDGWFGERNDDAHGLGDYDVNEKKLPGGLAGLAGKVNDLGMDFGLWMEPEMVSPKSKLYEAHPEWAVTSPGTDPSLGRNQLVLDLCQKEVRDYIVEQVNKTIASAPISYVKWDMNRQLSDCYSAALQGKFAHTWVLGLYEIFGRICRANPEVLFEGCSAGGNRFDLGVLCYMPQIWTSDDTDAYERMKIQTGTSYGYPQSVMSCHVSASPNHQTTRTSSLESRFDVASFGVLGYELDLTQISSSEAKVIANQIAFYKEHRKLLQFGEFVRVKSPFAGQGFRGNISGDGEQCVWMIVSEDKKEALVMEAIGRVVPNSESMPLRLSGLNADKKYDVSVRREEIDIRAMGSLINQVLPVKVNSNGILVHIASDYYMLPCEEEHYQLYGDLMMEAGMRLKQRFVGTGYNENVRLMGDYGARIYYLCEV